jgi:hypothetical protein
MASMKRRIIFARLQLAGNVDFQLQPALAFVNGLPHTQAGRNMPWSNGEELTCLIDGMGATPSFRMARLRNRGLPPVANGGKISDLHIPPGSSLAEQTHMVYFASDGILGIELNPDGPRPPSIRGYLRDRLNPHPPDLFFFYLVNKEVSERLERLEYITKFTIRVRKNHLKAIHSTSGTLQKALKAALEPGPEVVEMTLSCEPFSKHDIGATLLDDAKMLAASDAAFETIDKLQIEGYEADADRVTFIDVLSDKLLARKTMSVVERPHSQHIDSDSACKAIREAYKELRAELLHAGGVAP